MIRRTSISFPLAISATLLLGCTSPPATPDHPHSVPAASNVTVVRQDLRPTVAITGTVTASPEFTISAPVDGAVKLIAKEGESIKAGSPIATVGKSAITLPIDSVIEAHLASNNETVPAGLPVVKLRYSGFALAGPVAPAMAWMTLPSATTGKGQIQNGPAPFDCLFIAAGPEQQATSPTRICLIPKNLKATAGTPGIAVLSSTPAKQVLTVPLSSVAGRQNTGQVTLITDDSRKVVEVQLGLSDGTSIEISSGLSEGQIISGTAPTLDLKVGE